MDEPDLVKLAQRGSLEAYNELVLMYQDRIYAQAFRILEDGPLAEDITQEAFLAAYYKLDSFRGGSFKSWLFRIVINSSLDELRRRRRKPSIPLDILNSEGDEIESPSWMVDPGESPETLAEKTEFWKDIEQMLAKLPQVFRIAIILVDIQGLNYQEAAEVLKVSIGTVKSRLARGRRMMARVFKGRAPSLEVNWVLPSGVYVE